MTTTLRVIDSISRWVGHAVKWFAVALVCLGAYEVVMRYAFNSPTRWGYETLFMLGAALYALSWAYVHLEHGHIRLDVFYGRLSARAKAIIDVACTTLFFFPLIGALIYMSGLKMWHAWKIGEISIEGTWYPPLGPIRTVVFIGLCLFALQGIAQYIRDLHVLLRHRTYD